MNALAALAVRLAAVARWLLAVASMTAVPLLALLAPWMASDALRESENGAAVLILAIVLIAVTVLVIGGGYAAFLAFRAEMGATNFVTYVTGVRRRRVLVPLGAAVVLSAAYVLAEAGDARSLWAAAALAAPALYAMLWALRPPRPGPGETVAALLARG